MRDHKGRVAGDHGRRLLRDALRSPGRSTETPERAFSAAKPAKHHDSHSENDAAQEKMEGETSTCDMRSAYHALVALLCVNPKHDVPILSFSMSDESKSEEWWSVEARPKGNGTKQPRPIDVICSVSSDSSSTPDATTARWYEAFATRSFVRVDPSVGVVRSPKNSASIEECETSRCRRIIAALVPNIEARAVTVALASQKTSVVLEAVLLAANTSASAGERLASAQ